MADLDFALVIGRFGINLGDGADPNETPDTIWCDEGICRIAPLQSPTKVIDGSPMPWTGGNAAIDTTFDSDGHVSWNSKPRVWVVDLTSEQLIPHVAEGDATHRLTFIGVKANGIAVEFPPANVRLAADTMTPGIDPETGDPIMACDLTKLMPVPVGPGVAIVVGDQGVSVTGVVQETPDEFALELSDGSTTAPVELPVGPGGSDPGVAGYLDDDGSATTAAALARVKADLEKSSGSVLAPVVTAQTLDVVSARDALNIVDFGVVRGTATSQTTAIKAALDAHPGEAFYFPPGDYRLDTSLTLAGNTIVLAPGARLYAGAAMNIMVDADNGAVSVANYAQDTGIYGGGLLDGNLLAKRTLAVGSVIRFTMDGFTIKDPLLRGIWLKPAGAEVIGRNLRLHNTGTTNAGRTVSVTTTNASANITGTGFTADEVGSPIFGTGIPAGATIASYTSATAVTLSQPATASATVTAAIPNNIAIEADMGDCQFSDIITRDFTVGLWDKGGNVWRDFHPWIGTTAQCTVRFPMSRAFIIGKLSALDRPYSDTYRYGFTGWLTPGYSLGYSGCRIRNAKFYINQGNLTNALAAANPGAIFDLMSADAFETVGGDYRGHTVTPSVFVQGDTSRFNASQSTLPNGGVTGVADWRSGVRITNPTANIAPFTRGTTIPWTPNLFGSTTVGNTTYTTRNGVAEVRDGTILYRFRITGTFGTAGDAPAGKLRIGPPPFPLGAVSTGFGYGSISRRIGFTTAFGVAGGNGISTDSRNMIVYTDTGAEIDVVPGQAFDIFGELACPFVYPS